MRRILYCLLPLAATVSAAPASAQGGAWRVSEVMGDVRITEGGQTRPATRGALLSGGSVIAGARARAVLVRGRQYVVVAPNSTLRVDGGGSADGNMVQMILDAGNAVFRVNRRETPHFRVQTRYLAAVVRGTTFSVSVTPTGGSVQVTEGAVEVSTPDGGAKDLIRPGMIARVDSTDLYRLSISGDQSRTIRSPAAPAGVPGGTVASRPVAAAAPRIDAPIGEAPVRLSEATNGLVRGGAAITHAIDRTPDAGRGRSSTDGPRSDRPGQGGGEGARGGDRGHGNDADGRDEDNPGRGGGGDRPDRGSRDEERPGRGGDDDKPGRGGGDDKPGHGDHDRPGRDGDAPGRGDGSDTDKDEERGNRDGRDGDQDKPDPLDGPGEDKDKPERGDDSEEGKDKPDRGDDPDQDKPGRGGGGGDDDDGGEDKPGRGDGDDKDDKGKPDDRDDDDDDNDKDDDGDDD